MVYAKLSATDLFATNYLDLFNLLLIVKHYDHHHSLVSN